MHFHYALSLLTSSLSGCQAWTEGFCRRTGDVGSCTTRHDGAHCSQLENRNSVSRPSDLVLLHHTASVLLDRTAE